MEGYHCCVGQEVAHCGLHYDVDYRLCG
jgi:hypothetical protein